MSQRTCDIDGCEQPHQARGWCKTHYKRWQRRGGDPAILLRIQGDDMARFKSHIRMLPNECWEWTGGMFNGYGYMGNCNATRYAHRWYWIQVNGPVPNDAPLDHYRYPERGCIGRACCNPDHVRPVTHWENILRGVGPTAQNKAKTHCPDEHEYTPENTYLTPSGGRGCRECTRRAGREWYAKRGRALRQARRDAERR